MFVGNICYKFVNIFDRIGNANTAENVIIINAAFPNRSLEFVFSMRDSPFLFLFFLYSFLAVFAFPSIINNSIQIGLATIPAYIFGSVFYFLPFILMIAEFASANSEKESGVHSWLECVLGPKWAFLGACNLWNPADTFYTNIGCSPE